MTATLSIERDGAPRARRELERCVGDGGVAIFPADTLYGLACDPLRAAALERIARLKGRQARKPSAVLYFSPLVMLELVAGLGPRTREAIGALLPGPLTLVIDNPERRYPLACEDDPRRLGVRLIAGPLAGASCPVLQTSANRSGEPAPARFGDVDPELVSAVDLAIDGGELAGEPSTVVDVSGIDAGEPWEVLREGAVGAAEIGALLAGLGSGGPASPAA